MSLQVVLASYSHIELTDDEYCMALIEAKRKKEELLKKKEREQRAEKSRQQLTGKIWSEAQTRDYMLYRAGEMWGGEFKLDDHNKAVFDLLCLYFSNDAHFVKYAKDMGVRGASLDKGILLAGNFGVGKTWMMSLFRKNNRRVYHVAHAKDIAREYKKNGIEAIEKYFTRVKNPFNDPTVFYQEYAGLCIEDIGAEDVRGHYGDKCLVIEEIVESRYSDHGLVGWFHGTTNLTSEQIKEYYGGRVVDRLRQSVNFIELGGPSRRK